MTNSNIKEMNSAADYTENLTIDPSFFEDYQTQCVEEGNAFIKALLDHMAECPETFVPAVVNDSINFTFAYAEEHPLYFLSSTHYRPLFTEKDSLWSEDPSYLKVKERFQGYAKETDRDVIELLSYLNAITLMSINSLSLEMTAEGKQDVMDQIKLIALDLFCILDNI